MDIVLTSPTFWVGVSFIAFVALVVYYKVPKMATDWLDARAAAIAKELEEAAKLREEAQAVLASYQRKQRDAEQEAADIISLAKAEAERMRKETEANLAAQIERRTRQAEDKIAQAEAQALAEVKQVAIDTAVAAARQILSENMDEAQSAALIDKSIEDIKAKLH